MLNVESGICKTNSSDTYSICICTEDKYNEWIKNELYFDNHEFLTKRQVINKLTSCEWNSGVDFWAMSCPEFDTWAFQYGFYTIYNYNSSPNYLNVNRYTEHFVTPSGDKMVVFGLYRYDD